MADKAQSADMLLIQSDDYWGYAGNFEPEYNFFQYTFILSNANYGKLENDSEKARFFPCALFYYKGEADNHGYNPSQIAVKGNLSVVVGTNRLGNREKRRYNVGSSYGYSIPGSSLVMLEAPAKKTYKLISEAVENGNITTPGEFAVTSLNIDPAEIVTAINATMTQSAESYSSEYFEAEGGLDVGSVTEPAQYSPDDYNPENYTPQSGMSPAITVADDTATTVESVYEVASESQDLPTFGNVVEALSSPANHDPLDFNPETESPQDYEPDSSNFIPAEQDEYLEVAAEEYNHTVGNFTQDSSGAGYGVPEYYGSGSAGEVNMSLEAEGNEELYAPNMDFDGTNPEDMSPSPAGYETHDAGVDTLQSNFYAEGVPTDYVPPTEEGVGEHAEAGYLQGYSSGNAIGTITANWDGTPNAFAAEEFHEALFNAEQYTSLEAEYFESEGEFSKTDMTELIHTLRSIIDELEDEAGDDPEGSAAEAFNEVAAELMELEDQMEDALSMLAAEDLEVLSDGYGQNSAWDGHGVPVWYGSAESFEADRGMYQRPVYDAESFESEFVHAGMAGKTKAAYVVGAGLVGALVARWLSQKQGAADEDEADLEDDSSNE